MGHFRMISKVRHIDRYHLTKIIFAGILLLLNACSTPEKISSNEVKNRYLNLTPQQAMQQTAERYQQATSEKYDYYSPENWKLASEALDKAKALAKKNPSDQEIFKKLFLVDRRIDSAKYIKDRASREFADLFEHNRILQKNQAPATFKEPYSAVAKQLAKLMRDYEKVTLGLNAETENIRTVNINANKILQSMRALNIRAVKHNYLAGNIQRLKALEGQDAAQIAPVSHQQALTALQAANIYIENNVHDAEGVKNMSDQFIFSVSHLDHVLKEIVALSSKDIRKLEKVILTQEQYLLKIGQALNGLDVRNLPLASQAESVIKTAGNVTSHHSEKNNMIIELTEKNLVLESQLKKLSKTDDAANAKLKGKIQLLEMDIQALQKEREKLKEDMFALQQKNIDLAIQNAKLLSTVEGQQGNFKANEKKKMSNKPDIDVKVQTGTKPAEVSRFSSSANQKQAILQ